MEAALQPTSVALGRYRQWVPVTLHGVPCRLMDTATIEALNRASSQELFHLSLVIERLMTDPKRVLAIRMRLHLGQTVRYVDCRQVGAGLNLRTGRIVANT